MTATTASTFDYELPSLGADMDVGRVVDWTVQVGDVVGRGDVVARVETEKSDIDVEIWRSGVIEEFLVELGVEIPVGTPILRVALDGGEQSDPSNDSEAIETRGSATATSADAEQSSTGRSSEIRRGTPWPSADFRREPTGGGASVTHGRRVLASPLARQLAHRHGVAVADIAGTGPRGAVVSADVLRHAETSADRRLPRPEMQLGPAASEPVDPMRRLIAARVSQSNRDIPHYYLQRDVDLTALTDWLEHENAEREVGRRLLPAAALVRAVALAAQRHPELNGFWKHDRFEPGEAINVAMAISLRRGGLVTPNVADADLLSIDETMARLRELVAAARTGTLRASWMTGSTITLTNLGDRGADLVQGVISPPQVALVGFGRSMERPWVIDGQIRVRTVATATLAADHRATDGAIGSRYLTTLADLLEHPEDL